jgi:hypothetical protein
MAKGFKKKKTTTIVETTVSRGAVETVEVDPSTMPVPNNPSFDTDKGKPNLREGEEVIAESKRDGLERWVTSCGRVIFSCSIKEYEKVYGPLKPKALWAKAYPKASE